MNRVSVVRLGARWRCYLSCLKFSKARASMSVAHEYSVIWWKVVQFPEKGFAWLKYKRLHCTGLINYGLESNWKALLTLVGLRTPEDTVETLYYAETGGVLRQ